MQSYDAMKYAKITQTYGKNEVNLPDLDLGFMHASRGSPEQYTGVDELAGSLFSGRLPALRRLSGEIRSCLDFRAKVNPRPGG